jgi:CRP/FNR family transcriptional regulator, cyclic AMP receptor protein
MANQAEIIEHLSRIPLFADCSKAELKKIARLSNEETYPDGTVIVEQGNTGRTAYVILEGRTVVRRGSRKIAELDKGSAFGEMSLLDHGPRTAYVLADGDVTVLAIHGKDFEKLLMSVPTLAVKTAAGLSRRVRELDRKAFG